MFGFFKKRKAKKAEERARAAQQSAKAPASEVKAPVSEAKVPVSEVKAPAPAPVKETAKQPAPAKKPETVKASTPKAQPAKKETAASAAPKPTKAPAKEPAPAKAPASEAKAPVIAKEPEPVKEPAPMAAAEQVAHEVATKSEVPRGKNLFEINRTEDGQYTYCLRAGNTQIVAVSDPYTTMAACRNGIDSVGANAPIAPIEDLTLKTVSECKFPKFQITKDEAGRFRFSLFAQNGQDILHGAQSYAQKSSCKNTIATVVANAHAMIRLPHEDHN